MTTSPIRRYLLPAAGFAAFVVAVVWVNANADQVDYPFDVWRMDLDDFVANVAIIAGAGYGIWKVKRNTDQARALAAAAEATTATLERKFNGGLVEAARSHMQDNELFESLMVRVDRIEKERDDCQDALSDLRAWVIGRLDQIGREDT